MFTMNMFLIRCKGEGMHNPVFTKSIDNILDAGRDFSDGSIKWLFLFKGEADSLGKRAKKLNAQIRVAKKSKDVEKLKALSIDHKNTVEAAANMLQILQNATKSIQV